VVIGHGLDVFLKAYSNKAGDDRRALADKAAQMRAQLDATPQSLT